MSSVPDIIPAPLLCTQVYHPPPPGRGIAHIPMNFCITYSTARIKKKSNFPIRKFRTEQLQSHIWRMAPSCKVTYLRISSYIRKPFLIYYFATAPFRISWYMRKIWFSFLAVRKLSTLHPVFSNIKDELVMRKILIFTLNCKFSFNKRKRMQWSDCRSTSICSYIFGGHRIQTCARRGGHQYSFRFLTFCICFKILCKCTAI